MIDLILAAALLQATPDPCNAAGQAETPLAGCPAWRFVRRNEEGRGYVDPVSARRDGDRVQLMTRILADRPLQSRIYSFNTALELDCARRTTLALHFTAFDAQGAIILEMGRADRAMPAQRGSAFAALLQEFCQR